MNRQLQSLLVALACLAVPATAAAQRPTTNQRQVDSLAAEIRGLRARLDSVLALLTRLQARPAVTARDTTHPAAGDDLAALRAAAAAAAGRGTGPRPPTPPPTQVVGRGRKHAPPQPGDNRTRDVRVYRKGPRGARGNIYSPPVEGGLHSA